MTEVRELFHRTETLLAAVESIRRELDQLRHDLAVAESLPPWEAAWVETDGSVADVLPFSQEETSPTNADDERRSTVRQTSRHLLVTLTTDTEGEPFPGWVVDFSPAGLGLVVDDEIPAGSGLHLRPFQAPEAHPWIGLVVRNVRPEDGHWRLGCQFHTEVTWDDLRELRLV